MNNELRKLHEWLCINRLSLNITKTNFVIFHPKNKPKVPVTILINKEAIDEEYVVKYLGVLVDSQLTFKFHIDELKKKVSRAIGVLYKLKPFVPPSILINVYYSIIYPFLLYGVLIWGNADKTLLKPIHILQKKFVRMATFNDSFPTLLGPLVHTPPLFHKLGLLTIFEIFELQLGKIVYESINGIGPVNKVVILNFVSEIHGHNTRQATQRKIYKKSVRTTHYGLKGLNYLGGDLWDSMPNEMKGSTNKRLFTHRFNNYLIKKYGN